MKDTFYFSHDYNARSDDKIKPILRKFGMLGYGVFWSIIEDLYNNANSLRCDYEGIAYDLRIEEDIVRSIVNDFDLFKIHEGLIYSESVKKRLEERDKKSSKAKESVSSRWHDGKSKNRERAEKCILYVIKIYDENEHFLKVGITSESVSRRYSGKLNGYEFELLFSHDDEVEICLNIENEINKLYAKYTPKIKFAGCLECYNISDANNIIDFVIRNTEIRNTNDEIRNTIKERKGKEIKINFEHFPEYEKILLAWFEYKRCKKQSYKNIQSQELFYKSLLKLSNSNIEMATKIINQSMANNWSGIFELKQEHKKGFQLNTAII